MAVMLHCLFSITLYPTHISLCATKNRTSTFHNLSIAKTVRRVNSWCLYQKLRLVKQITMAFWSLILINIDS